MSSRPSRSEVWLADLDPTRGHEQRGPRPVLVVSTDRFNHGPSGLVIVAPITKQERDIPVHVRIDPPQGGCTVTSYILCDSIRSVSRDRLIKLRGTVDNKTMAEVSYALCALMDL